VSLTVIFRPEAEEDLRQAFNWYKEQRKGLGIEFLQSIDASISSIQHNPEAYPFVYKNIHRTLVRRFPYGIFYIVDKEVISIIACFHFRQSPKHWQSRK
jgi:plasmid stabilization system protein ParE